MEKMPKISIDPSIDQSVHLPLENTDRIFEYDLRNYLTHNPEQPKSTYLNTIRNGFWKKTLAKERNNPVYGNRHFKEIQFESKILCSRKLTDWFKITILQTPYYGATYEKEYILNALLSYLTPVVFVPIMYKALKYEAIFYVDDYKMVNTLLTCDRKVTMPDGHQLTVTARPGFPQYDINDKYKKLVTQVIFKRYKRKINALDLSKFHHDPDFVDNCFCALVFTSILKAVLDIVGEHIPTLEVLNLENNKLHNINKLSELKEKFSNLKILHIGNNKIKEIYQIDAIKGLKLEELKLAGNPVCDKYKLQQNDYICDIRKRFPQLLRLDDKKLPQAIIFDVIDTVQIPQPQRIIFTDMKAHQIACQFLQQYFSIFDSKNRQSLLDAYNEQAYFSMTIPAFQANKLNQHLMNSRNLFIVNKTVKRYKLLKYGRLPIVSFILEMPQTNHFLETFTMDITLPTQTMMFITITGYFQEFNNKNQSIRYFNRTFIIVPEGNGYCICNEQLHISQPSEAQLKQLNQQIKLNASKTAKPVVSELSENERKYMIELLSQQTNMNLEWSLKCLQELHWNYDNAHFAFQEFFKRGQVPSEAFMKCT